MPKYHRDLRETVLTQPSKPPKQIPKLGPLEAKTKLLYVFGVSVGLGPGRTPPMREWDAKPAGGSRDAGMPMFFEGSLMGAVWWGFEAYGRLSGLQAGETHAIVTKTHPRVKRTTRLKQLNIY